MNIRAAHAVAGFSTGLVFYAAYLYCFIFFGPRSSIYWSRPMPHLFNSAWDYRRSVLYALWQFNRLEVIAVLIGLAFPIAFAGVAWFRAGRRPISWLRYWYFQLAFAVAGIIAVLAILNGITFILTFILPILPL